MRDRAYWAGQGLGLAACGLGIAIQPLAGAREWTVFAVGGLFGAAAVLMLWGGRR